MNDVRPILERGLSGFDPGEAYGRTLRKARRRQRYRQVVAGGVALAIAGVGMAVALQALSNSRPRPAASPGRQTPPSEVRGPARVLAPIADIAMADFVTLEPSSFELPLDSAPGFGADAILLEFPLVRPPACLGEVVLELFSLDGHGPGPAVYPAEIVSVKNLQARQRLGHTVLDVRPNAKTLADPTNGWARYDVTEIYRLWLDETFTRSGRAPISTNVILTIRPEESTYEFRRRYASQDRAPDVAPRLIVREEPCGDEPLSREGPVVVASGRNFGRDWRATVERHDSGWSVGADQVVTMNPSFAEASGLIFLGQVSQGTDNVLAGGVWPRDLDRVMATLDDGREIQALLFDVPDQLEAPFRVFVLLIPEGTTGVVVALDGDGRELTRALLALP